MFVIHILTLLISVTAIAQAGTQFKLTDTAFTVGSVYAWCDIRYDLDGHSTIREESLPCLDSVADFMKRHPELIFEIGSYTDQRGGDSSNLKLSQARANMVRKYLEQRGVSWYSLAAVGYGEQFPLIPQSQIDTAKTQTIRERLYQQNRRTEFKILYAHQRTFTMNDSTFQIGDVMWLHVIYDLGKATIRPDSYPLLDSLANFLIQHADIVVEISGHTDARGSDKYSIRLSDVRAHAVFNYLVSKGVSANNMKYAGYSDTRPLVPEKQINRIKSKEGQEQLHQLNRRTEIRIISFW